MIRFNVTATLNVAVEGQANRWFPWRIALAIAVLMAEVGVVLFLYRYDAGGVFGPAAEIKLCPAFGLPSLLCDAFFRISSVGLWLTFVLVSCALMLPKVRASLQAITTEIETSQRSYLWLALSVAGVLAFIMPHLMVAAGEPTPAVAALVPLLWLLGPSSAAAGLVFWLGNPLRLARHISLNLAATLILLPFASLPFWAFENFIWPYGWVKDATFFAVTAVLDLLGQDSVTIPERSIIGIGSFRVWVGSSCSGISGMVLVSAVMIGYVFVLRNELYIGRALLLIPLAAALSWLLNAIRVAVLLMIGAYVSPTLAVEGFHSYAGWIAFILLSALMLLVAEKFRWIHRHAPRTAKALPLLRDPVVAQITPFIVLLASSLLVSAIFTKPELGYPLHVTLMTTALLAFWPAFKIEIPTFDPLPYLSGLLVAAVWLSITSGGNSTSTVDILGTAGYGTAAVWITLRVFGTVALVPVIEEMFFRGYLLQRLNFGGTPGILTALAVSSVLFGALHADIWLATASGLVFGLVALRRGRVFDAIAAHAAANATIAGWALWFNDWSVI